VKLTNKQLRQIIKEELEAVIGENQGHHWRGGDPMASSFPVVISNPKISDIVRIKYGNIDKQITREQYGKYGKITSNPDDAINMLVQGYGFEPEEAQAFKWFYDAKGTYLQGE